MKKEYLEIANILSEMKGDCKRSISKQSPREYCLVYTPICLSLIDKHRNILELIRIKGFSYSHYDLYRSRFNYSFYNVIEYVSRTIGLHPVNDMWISELIEDLVSGGCWNTEYEAVNALVDVNYSEREKEIFKEIMEGKLNKILEEFKNERMIERIIS